MKITDNLLRSSLFIEVIINEYTTATATCFVINHKSNLYLVTNAHVITNILDYKVYFPTLEQIRGETHNSACVKNKEDMNTEWKIHSSEDIAALSLENIQGIPVEVFGTLLTSEFISEKEAKVLSPIQRLIAIGYPRGNFDRYSGMPISKSGIISTPYKFSIEGHQRFLCDIFADTGSSGSPVYAVFDNDEIKLLGIITGGKVAFTNVIGKDYANNDYHGGGNEQTPPVILSGEILQSSCPVGITLCVKASAILDLVNSFKQKSFK